MEDFDRLVSAQVIGRPKDQFMNREKRELVDRKKDRRMRKREGGEEKDDWKRFGTSETCRWSMAEVFRSRDEWKRVRGEDCILIVKCEAEVYKVLAFFYIMTWLLFRYSFYFRSHQGGPYMTWWTQLTRHALFLKYT